MIDTSRYLAREQQFCTLCYATGKGWVRVINVHRLVELRREQTTERMAVRAFRIEREKALRHHYTVAHPDKRLD